MYFHVALRSICTCFHTALRVICMASNRFRDSSAVFARVFTWLCEVFAWLPIGLETPEWYLHVFSRGSARYLHDFQQFSKLLSDICTCFHMAMHGISTASNRFTDYSAVFARVFIWLCDVFAWLPIGLETPEWYLHMFSRGSARYLHGFQ